MMKRQNPSDSPSGKSRESPRHSPFTGKYWLLTTQIKGTGPNRLLLAPWEEGLVFRQGDRILGESEIGPVPMSLVESPRIQSTDDPATPPEFRFLRFIDPQDAAKTVTLRAKESTLTNFVKERSRARNLGMNIVEVVGNLQATEFIIYYTAEGRVDFRELVKDIHSSFRGRHELRQISPREHSALLDGLGPCGKPLCCSTFLKEFQSVSTRHARDFDPDMNPMKTTGMCGRLKCCLSFEKSDEREEKWVPVDNDPRGLPTGPALTPLTTIA
ncbi:MAG: hypothetical protein M1297_06160 [Nitrospirae bacterium]|jgi:cell fate regulator YaaT (PSP1 superfamily)|nr:hypothetical protein [Nitrospirota bacterium]